MLQDLIMVFFINLLAAMSPGPDFAIVLSNTLKHGRVAGILTSFGIATALFIHCSYCSLGLTDLLTKVPVVMEMISILGSVYLFYIGVGIIRNRNNALPETATTEKKTQKTKQNSSYIQGFLTCLLNPKAILFIIALFSTMIKPTSILQGYIFSSVMIIPAVIWFICLSCLLTTKKAQQKLRKFQPKILMTMGLLLILIGVVVFIELLMKFVH